MKDPPYLVSCVDNTPTKKGKKRDSMGVPLSATILAAGLRQGELTIIAVWADDPLDEREVPSVPKIFLAKFSEIMPSRLPKHLPPKRGIDHKWQDLFFLSRLYTRCL